MAVDELLAELRLLDSDEEEDELELLWLLVDFDCELEDVTPTDEEQDELVTP